MYICDKLNTGFKIVLYKW